ncbi:hypothetical protein MRX96_000636 [Rhipicephalus microplus]
MVVRRCRLCTMFGSGIPNGGPYYPQESQQPFVVNSASRARMLESSAPPLAFGFRFVSSQRWMDGCGS